MLKKEQMPGAKKKTKNMKMAQLPNIAIESLINFQIE
jgi:hypothetical protein